MQKIKLKKCTVHSTECNINIKYKIYAEGQWCSLFPFQISYTVPPNQKQLFTYNVKHNYLVTVGIFSTNELDLIRCQRYEVIRAELELTCHYTSLNSLKAKKTDHGINI